MLNHLSDLGNPNLPRYFFAEPGLNNAITSVCVILPERLYDDVANTLGRVLGRTPAWEAALDAETFSAVMERNYTEWEREFLRRKALCGLAS